MADDPNPRAMAHYQTMACSELFGVCAHIAQLMPGWLPLAWDSSSLTPHLTAKP